MTHWVNKLELEGVPRASVHLLLYSAEYTSAGRYIKTYTMVSILAKTAKVPMVGMIQANRIPHPTGVITCVKLWL